MYLKRGTKKSTESCSQQIEQLRLEIQQADAVVMGAEGTYLELGVGAYDKKI